MHEQFPTFASDFTKRFLGISPAGVVCVGVLCFRVMHEDVRRWKWVAQGVWGLSTSVIFCACTVPGPFFFVLPRVIGSFLRVKCDLLFGFHLASWTAVDLITAHCVHTHKPISTLQDKQQMQILLCRALVTQVNLRPGRDINSSAPHRWKMYTFPRPVCVPVANERVGFAPCLTSFRPLSMLTQPRTKTTGADWMRFD